MSGIPWWVWAVVGVFAAYRLALLAMSKAFRLMIRREFVSFVRDFDPDVEILGVGERRLRVRSGEEAAVDVELGPLYRDVVASSSADGGPRPRLYWRHLKRLHAAASGGQPLLTAERYAGRLRPQLFTSGMLAGPGGSSLPRTPFGATGLSVVYAIDGRTGAVVVDGDDARELGLDAAGLHARAVENLRGGFPAEAVRSVLDKGEGAALKLDDSYSAARVLLVPEHLRDGEEVAALVPDRDSLVLVPLPGDGDWNRLREGVRIMLGHQHGWPLLDRPLRVGRTTVELV